MIRKVEFHGEEYLLIPHSRDRDGLSGAIATKQQFEHFRDSHAHLFADGKVRRYGSVIGTRDDVKVIGEVDEGTLELKEGQGDE